jgi:hypothetical protein
VGNDPTFTAGTALIQEFTMPVRIRALVDNLTIDNHTLQAGEEADCPTDRAKVLVSRNLAELVDAADAPRDAFREAERIAAERAAATRAFNPETAVKRRGRKSSE